MIDLKAFRKANHLTQIELADYFGVGQGFISQMEKGDRPIPSEYISKIFANPHDWDTSMLRDSDQSENPMTEQPEEKRMIDTLLFLVESQKKDIETLIQLVKEKDTKIDELLTLAQDKDERIEELLDEINARKRGDATGAARSSAADAV